MDQTFYDDGYLQTQLQMPEQNMLWTSSQGEHGYIDQPTFDGDYQPISPNKSCQSNFLLHQLPNGAVMTGSLALNTNLAPNAFLLDFNTLSATSSDATAETGFQPFTPLDAALPPFPALNKKSCSEGCARPQSTIQLHDCPVNAYQECDTSFVQPQQVQSSSVQTLHRSESSYPHGLAVTGLDVSWTSDQVTDPSLDVTAYPGEFETTNELGQPVMMPTQFSYPSTVSPGYAAQAATPRQQPINVGLHTPTLQYQFQTPMPPINEQSRCYSNSTTFSSPAFSYTSSLTPSLSRTSTPRTAVSMQMTPRSSLVSPRMEPPHHRRSFSHASGKAIRSPTYLSVRQAPYSLDPTQQQRRMKGISMSLPCRKKPSMIQHSLSDSFVPQLPSMISASPLPMSDSIPASFSETNLPSLAPAPDFSDESYLPVPGHQSECYNTSSQAQPGYWSTPCTPMQLNFDSPYLQQSAFDLSDSLAQVQPEPLRTGSMDISTPIPTIGVDHDAVQTEMADWKATDSHVSSAAFEMPCPAFADTTMLPYPEPAHFQDDYQCSFVQSGTPVKTNFSLFSPLTICPASIHLPQPSNDHSPSDPSSPSLEDMHPANQYFIPTVHAPKFPGDVYSPKYKRRSAQNTKAYEGWCGICQKWLNMKNSRYWEDKARNHGVCARTKKNFTKPVERRLARVDARGMIRVVMLGQEVNKDYRPEGIHAIDSDSNAIEKTEHDGTRSLDKPNGLEAECPETGMRRGHPIGSWGQALRQGMCGECQQWINLDTKLKSWTGWWVHAAECHSYAKRGKDRIPRISELSSRPIFRQLSTREDGVEKNTASDPSAFEATGHVTDQSPDRMMHDSDQSDASGLPTPWTETAGQEQIALERQHTTGLVEAGPQNLGKTNDADPTEKMPTDLGHEPVWSATFNQF